MALLSHVGTFTSPASNGSLPVTGIGFQPKIIILVDGRSADETGFGTGAHGAAVSDTAQWACSGRVSGSNGNATRGHSNNHCLAVMGGSTSSFFVSASLTSMDSDGFTLDYDNTGAELVIKYLALGGDDLEDVNVVTEELDFGTSGTSITGVGFEPNLIIGMNGTSSFQGEDLRTNASISSGVTHATGSQNMIQAARADGTGEDSHSDLLSTHFAGRSAFDGTPFEEVVLTSFDSDGFTVDLDGPSGGVTHYGFVCMNITEVHTGVITQPTSTGTQAITGLGFQPSAMYIAGAGKESGESTSTAYWMSGVADQSLNQACSSLHWVDLSDNVASGASDTEVIRHVEHDSGSAVELVAATLDSYDSDGFTLDWTAVDSTEREFWYVALGGATAAVTAELGLLTETIALQPITAQAQQLAEIGLLTEMTSLQPVGASTQEDVELGLLTETTALQPITAQAQQLAEIGLLTETTELQSVLANLGGNQFLIDFRDLSPGSVPSNITVKDNARDGTWDMAEVLDQNRLRFFDDAGGSGQTLALFDDVTGLGDRETEEVLSQMYISDRDSTGTHHGVVVRYQNDSPDYTFYFATLRMSTQSLQIARFVDGSFTSLETRDLEWNTDTFYNIRLRVSGTGATVTLEASAWAIGGEEPEDPWVSVEDTAADRITTPDRTGVFTGRSEDTTRAWSFISVARSGEVAEHPTPVVGTTVTTGFDAANAHPQLSGIEDDDTSQPRIDILPRIQDTGGFERWQQYVIRLNNADGKQPTFRLNQRQRSDGTDGDNTSFFSEDGGETWQRPSVTLDTVTWGVDSAWQWQFPDPFTAEEVLVAFMPSYPLSRVVTLYEWVETNHGTMIHELPSNSGDPDDFVSRRVSAQTDDLGRDTGSTPFYAYGLWDPDGHPVSERPVILLFDGIHAGEQMGSWVFEGFVKELMSGSAAANHLMQNFKFFVYPNVNPVGREWGHFRGQWDAADLTKDPNRDFLDEDSEELESTQRLVSAVTEDLTGEEAIFAFDFHGRTFDEDKNHFWATTFGDSDTEPWRSSFIAHLEAITDFGPHSFTPDNFVNLLTRWSWETFDNEHTYAIESNEREPGMTQTLMLEAGEDLVQATSDTLSDEFASITALAETTALQTLTAEGGEEEEESGFGRGGVIMRRRRN